MAPHRDSRPAPAPRGPTRLTLNRLIVSFISGGAVSSEAGRELREEGRASASQVDETRRSMLAKLGLAAGVGLLAAPDSARAVTTHFDDTVEVVPPPGNMALKVVCSGAVPESASVGG